MSRVTNSPSLLRHQDKVRAHAERRFACLVSSSRPETVARQFRTFLKLEDERLRVADRLGASGRWIACARSFTLDLLVQYIFRYACRIAVDAKPTGHSGELAIVAIGGYGRAELAPFSDLDILFLCPARATTHTSIVIEQCQHLAWDAGLSLGSKSYAVAECVPASRIDAHFLTALINTRLIAGDNDSYCRLLEALNRERERNQNVLLQTITKERDDLYQKRGATVYLQEPNVKDSAGGLRDLHYALWAVYALHGSKMIEGVLEHDLIEVEQYQRAVAAYDFLLRVRHHAHWIAGRKTDHLALDLQDTIAGKLGYSSSLHLKASEEFMRDYYRQAREVHHFSESLFGRVVDPLERSGGWFSTLRARRVDKMFSLKDWRLHFDGSPHLFAENPLLSFKAAALAQAHTVGLSPSLSAIIRRNLAAVDANFRKSPEAADCFLELLGQRGRVGHTLRLMQETGLLGRYLPEFDRVSMLIQHDLYHHYTVDEHTLRAVEALDALHNREASLSSLRAALEEIKDVRLLYLALLLHDLGKGRGSGHIPRGARIAERICERLSLDSEGATKVVKLVKYHVLMAHLSQRRDIREPRVAKYFASQVGSLDVLNMLFVLTYADLNAVGPSVWSDWKATLLEQLYTRTRAVFTGEALAIQDDLQQIKERVIERLAGTVSISEIERHFALSPARYLETITAEEVESHVVLVQQVESESFACRWQDRGEFATQLTISTRDRHGLFADIAGTLAASGIDVLSAEVNTREDGIALDSFVLQQAGTHRSIDGHRRRTIEHSLEASIKGEHDVAGLVDRWTSRHAPRRPQVLIRNRTNQVSVDCDNEASEATTLVEVRAADEHGLAFKISRTLTAFGVEIVCAKIATEKSDALDVFYVTGADGSKLDQASMEDLKQVLISALAKGEPR
ncbi:MAG TPA: [protein-PII] uridylyltransferase [Pyrinomonadaceae bacterium]|nr:[protein-PII] uridylyltransferase [Pyrinomonadaceae bacterium]